MKRTIPFFIASITGMFFVVAYFIPYTASWGEDKVAVWFDIVASIAVILGSLNLLKMSLKKISDRRPGWGYAAITVTAFAATLFVGLGKIGVNPSEKYPDFAWSGNHLENGSAFWWMYQYVYYPLAATMFALLAFFIASAAFLAFRAKNAEAIVLLGTAFVILVGRTYFGTVLSGPLPEDLQFSALTGTIMSVFNLAGNRAIMIGIALGTVSLSLRILMGVDRSYIGSE